MSLSLSFRQNFKNAPTLVQQAKPERGISTDDVQKNRGNPKREMRSPDDRRRPPFPLFSSSFSRFILYLSLSRNTRLLVRVAQNTGLDTTELNAARRVNWARRTTGDSRLRQKGSPLALGGAPPPRHLVCPRCGLVILYAARGGKGGKNQVRTAA